MTETAIARHVERCLGDSWGGLSCGARVAVRGLARLIQRAGDGTVFRPGDDRVGLSFEDQVAAAAQAVVGPARAEVMAGLGWLQERRIVIEDEGAVGFNLPARVRAVRRGAQSPRPAQDRQAEPAATASGISRTRRISGCRGGAAKAARKMNPEISAEELAAVMDAAEAQQIRTMELEEQRARRSPQMLYAIPGGAGRGAVANAPSTPSKIRLANVGEGVAEAPVCQDRTEVEGTAAAASEPSKLVEEQQQQFASRAPEGEAVLLEPVANEHARRLATLVAELDGMTAEHARAAPDLIQGFLDQGYRPDMVEAVIRRPRGKKLTSAEALRLKLQDRYPDVGRPAATAAMATPAAPAAPLHPGVAANPDWAKRSVSSQAAISKMLEVVDMAPTQERWRRLHLLCSLSPQEFALVQALHPVLDDVLEDGPEHGKQRANG